MCHPQLLLSLLLVPFTLNIGAWVYSCNYDMICHHGAAVDCSGFRAVGLHLSRMDEFRVLARTCGDGVGHLL